MTDELLHALGRHQREDLAAGEGERIAPDDDDERSRPFADDERADILDAVFARIDASAEARLEPRPEPSDEPAKVIELAPRRRPAIPAVLAAVLVSAAAAAALIWLGVSGEGPNSGQDQQLAMVPEYTIFQLRGGAASQRSDPDHALGEATPSLTLRASDEIDWRLTPGAPARVPVAMALLARSAKGEIRFAPQLAVEVSPEGAMRVSGPLASHLQLDPGEWTLELLLGEPSQLPSTSDEATASQAGAWRRIEIRVTIIPE